VVTNWLLEVTNVPPATLEIKPQVNQKSLVSRPGFGFIISGAPHFRNPYLTKVTNQLGSTLHRSRHLFDISRTCEITVSVFHHYFKCLNQGHLNQKATLIRPFQFSILPYKLCFCDISGGRTFLRSIYRFRTQLIETFSTFSLRLSA
jgi:hypothetical protein